MLAVLWKIPLLTGGHPEFASVIDSIAIIKVHSILYEGVGGGVRCVGGRGVGRLSVRSKDYSS